MVRLLFPLAITFALVALPAQTTADKQSNQKNSADTMQNGLKTGATGAKTRLSNEVADLLNATNEARISADMHNLQDAKFHINHALENAKMIERDAPNRPLIPLYDELDRYSVLGPLMTQKNQGTEGNQQASGASQSLAGTTTVQEVAGGYTNVALDIQAATDHLNAVKQAVQQNDYQKVDAALAAVQNGVVVTSVASDLPLLRARENLVLARVGVKNGNITQAQAALKSASNALMDYTKIVGPHAKDAHEMRSEIDRYEQSIQKHHSDAVTKIDNWWNETTDWITQVGNQTGS